MILGGLQKTTLIDFPGTIACTVFTVGCNFRCPFCHNRDLVTVNHFKQSKLSPISESYLFDFLVKRKKYLDGVCLTGGEPTIYSDLPEFISQIKQLGYKVKLDTNGTNPSMLGKLYQTKLLDYVAMDIKNNLADYDKVIKVKIPQLKTKITKSIALILNSQVDYDFRTTVVPGLHHTKKLKELAQDLVVIAKQQHYPANKIRYFIQNFRPKNCLDPSYLEQKPFTHLALKAILRTVKAVLPLAEIRGEE